jgi:hypothetical protein
MAAQDQRGEAQALWRPAVGEAKYSNAAMAVHRPRSSRRRESQRPERKAREQGLTTPERNSSRTASDQAVRQDLKRPRKDPKPGGFSRSRRGTSKPRHQRALIGREQHGDDQEQDRRQRDHQRDQDVRTGTTAAGRGRRAGIMVAPQASPLQASTHGGCSAPDWLATCPRRSRYPLPLAGIQAGAFVAHLGDLNAVEAVR